MIVETLIATVGAITCASLWFADRVLKRQREEDAELDRPTPVPPAPTPVMSEGARQDIREAIASWRERASNVMLSFEERTKAAKRVTELEDSLRR